MKKLKDDKKGPGRKKKTPTRMVRIPENGVRAARGLIDHFTKIAEKRIRDSEWYQCLSYKMQSNITVTLDKVEYRNTDLINEMAVLICTVTEIELGERIEMLIPLTL